MFRLLLRCPGEESENVEGDEKEVVLRNVSLKRQDNDLCRKHDRTTRLLNLLLC